MPDDGFYRENTTPITIKDSSRYEALPRNLIFAALRKEARDLGILPSEDPLEGIAVDIWVAKVLNSCLKKSSPG